jgi:hypothetical protein
MRRRREKIHSYKPRKEAKVGPLPQSSEGTSPVDTSILGCWCQNCETINFACLRSLICATLLKQTNTQDYLLAGLQKYKTENILNPISVEVVK